MKKYLISTFIFFIINIGYTQVYKDIKGRIIIKTKFDEYLITDTTVNTINKKNKNIREGVWFKKYLNGNVKSVYIYKKGKKDGSFYRFYYNGKLKCRGNYFNNNKNGLFLYYKKKYAGWEITKEYSNGKLLEKTRLKDYKGFLPG